MSDLIRKPASADKGGELTTGTQTIPGDKTFTGNVTIDGTSIKQPKNLLVRKTAVSPSQTSGATYTVNFETVVENTFDSGDYDIPTGLFTAPESGLYSISANLYFGDLSEGSAPYLQTWTTILEKNGSVYGRTVNFAAGGSSSLITRITDSWSATLTLNASDTIQVKASSTGTTWTVNGSSELISFLSITKIG